MESYISEGAAESRLVYITLGKIRQSLLQFKHGVFPFVFDISQDLYTTKEKRFTILNISILSY